jgi:hypothetical protein
MVSPVWVGHIFPADLTGFIVTQAPHNLRVDNDVRPAGGIENLSGLLCVPSMNLSRILELLLADPPEV